MAGLVSGACDSSSRSCGFKPHVRCGDYLKNEITTTTNENTTQTEGKARGRSVQHFDAAKQPNEVPMTEWRRQLLKSLRLPKGPSGDVGELRQVLQTIRQETSSPPDTAVGQLPFLHGVLSDFLFFIRKTRPFKRKSIREYWKNFSKFTISSGS